MINVVTASAGSGKTFRLAKEYIRLVLKSNDSYRRILAVTFTNKATTEMKYRILKELNILANQPTKSPYYKYLLGIIENKNKLNTKSVEKELQDRARTVLKLILNDYSSFSISTIDKFFQRVLKAFAREIGKNFNYQLELDKGSLVTECVDRILDNLQNTEKTSGNKESNSVVAWFIESYKDAVQEKGSDNFEKTFREFAQDIMSESFGYSINKSNIDVEKVYSRQELKKLKTDINDFLQKFKKDLKSKIDKLETEVCALNGINDLSDTYRGCLLSLKESIYKYCSSYSFKFADIKTDIFGKYTLSLDTNVVCGKRSIFKKDDIKKLKGQSIDVAEKAFSELKSYLENHVKIINTLELIKGQVNSLGLIYDINNEFKNLILEKNTLSIDDTNALLRDIIGNTCAPFIYEKIGVKYENYLLDEFQDTSIIQWENFYPLIEESVSNNNYCLIVGDVKQSIYRFRGSDWRLLNEISTVNPTSATSASSTSSVSAKSLSTDSLSANSVAVNSVSGNSNCSITNISSAVKQGIKSEELKINWRSCENIVDFNNQFFCYLRNNSQAYLPFDLQTENTVNEDHSSKNENPQIGQIYKNVEQEHKPSSNTGQNNKGNIEISYIENTPQRVVDIIKEEHNRGIDYKDIAVLVYVKKDGANIAKLLEDSNIPFVSDDALSVSSSFIVRRLLCLLKCVTNSEDAINKYILGIIQNDAKNNKNTSNYNFEIPQSYNSIIDLCEYFIRYLQLVYQDEFNNEVVYVEAFMDDIQSWISIHGNDLSEYITHFEENDLKISSSENGEAVNILTIHKSKGLEYKCVIIPFLEKVKIIKEDTSWCLLSNDESVNKSNDEFHIDLDKIKSIFGRFYNCSFSTKLKDDLFQKEQKEHFLMSAIDIINLTYVAFTRARQNLHLLINRSAYNSGLESSDSVFSIGKIIDKFRLANYGLNGNGKLSESCIDGDDQVSESCKESNGKDDADNKAKLKGVFTLVPVHLDSGATSVLSELNCEFNNEIKTVNADELSQIIFNIGDDLSNTEFKVDDERQVSNNDNVIESEYPSIPLNNDNRNLGFSAKSLEFFEVTEDNQIADKKMNGNLMHSILSSVYKIDDLKFAIENKLKNYSLDEKTKLKIESDLYKSLKLVEDRQWFDVKQNRVKNEVTIIDSDGSHYRPDRIVQKGDCYEIIDYKFGEYNEKYKFQIKRYIGLLRQMGFKNVKGYLWFVKPNELDIIEVK